MKCVELNWYRYIYKCFWYFRKVLILYLTETLFWLGMLNHRNSKFYPTKIIIIKNIKSPLYVFLYIVRTLYFFIIFCWIEFRVPVLKCNFLGPFLEFIIICQSCYGSVTTVTSSSLWFLLKEIIQCLTGGQYMGVSSFLNYFTTCHVFVSH